MLSILIVDDDVSTRIYLRKKISRDLLCKYFEAGNGKEALQILEKEKVDAIILDISMPIMNGIELLNVLKSDASLSVIPVLMLSCNSGREIVDQILRMGIHDYVVKPCTNEVAYSRIQNFLDRIMAKHEQPV